MNTSDGPDLSGIQAHFQPLTAPDCCDVARDDQSPLAGDSDARSASSAARIARERVDDMLLMLLKLRSRSRGPGASAVASGTGSGAWTSGALKYRHVGAAGCDDLRSGRRRIQHVACTTRRRKTQLHQAAGARRPSSRAAAAGTDRLVYIITNSSPAGCTAATGPRSGAGRLQSQLDKFIMQAQRQPRARGAGTERWRSEEGPCCWSS